MRSHRLILVGFMSVCQPESKVCCVIPFCSFNRSGSLVSCVLCVIIIVQKHVCVFYFVVDSFKFRRKTLFSCNWYCGFGLTCAHSYSYIQSCLGKSGSPVSWFPAATVHHCLKKLWERPCSRGSLSSVAQAAIAGAS